LLKKRRKINYKKCEGQTMYIACMHVTVIIFPKKFPERIVTQNLVGEGRVSDTDARKKRFLNAVPVFVLPRKNLRKGVPARSVTKIPMHICMYECV
jgi:hypothetical protein